MIKSPDDFRPNIEEVTKQLRGHPEYKKVIKNRTERKKKSEIKAIGTPAVMRVPTAEFIRVWNSSISIQAVADRLGIQRRSAKDRAKRLRAKGISLIELT